MREYCFGTITAAHGMASASQAATCSLFQELVRLERRGEANSQHRSHAANGPARRTSRQALQELIDQSWTRMPQVTKKLNSNWLTRHLHEHRCLVHGLFAPPVLAKLRFVTTPEDADIGQKRAGPFTSLPLYLGIGAEGGKQLLVILGNPISEIVPRGGSSGEMCLASSCHFNRELVFAITSLAFRSNDERLAIQVDISACLSVGLASEGWQEGAVDYSSISDCNPLTCSCADHFSPKQPGSCFPQPSSAFWLLLSG